MITYFDGDLFKATPDAFVQGCNTLGRMNAGIARQFKQRFPEMYSDYRTKCREDQIKPGTGYLYLHHAKPHVVNLITQDRGSAQIQYVDSAFKWLADNSPSLGLTKLAMPKIGSGLGELQWEEVERYLKQYFEESPLQVEVWSL